MLKDEIMTSDDVMEALGICRGTFYKRLKNGTIPKPISLGPHRKFWDRAKVMKFIKDGQIE